MIKIEKGEYVRTVDGKIGIFDRYSKRPENSIYKSLFNCFIKLKGHKTSTQCCEEYILKHSSNIINLIEVGDYVNGEKVIEVDRFTDWIDIGEKVLREENVKSIVTKEQFKSVEYKLEE